MSDFTLKYTSAEDVHTIYETLQRSFRKGISRPLGWRKHQLYQLARMLKENKDAILAAEHADLAKPALECLVGEIGAMMERSILSAQQLEEWSASQSVTVADWQKTWSPMIHQIPKGVVLVISPWNYPTTLSLQPLIGAIAAGCPAVVKPSEISAHHSALWAELFPKYLDPEAYAIVNGGVPETTKLLEYKWDHIFYTGNGRVGRVIAAAAAKHLTPCNLELGGKSPVIIDPDSCDMNLAAKRILCGKTTNAGQICVCPDYVLIPRHAQEAFIEELLKVHASFYPNESPLDSASLSSIVNDVQYDRLKDLKRRTKATLVLGGGEDESRRRMEPTVWKDVKEGDALLEMELFGPFLPIMPVDDIDQAIDYIERHDHPLVIYAFTTDAKVRQLLHERTRSGNIIFNDVVQQLSVNELPFSGIGESGYGYQIMKYTFECFSHIRSSVDIPYAFEPYLEARYAPYTEEKKKLIARASEMEVPESHWPPKPANNGAAP